MLVAKPENLPVRGMGLFKATPFLFGIKFDKEIIKIAQKLTLSPDRPSFSKIKRNSFFAF